MNYVTINVLPFFIEGCIFVNDANFAFFVIYVHEKAFIEVRLFIGIVLVCSEQQHVLKYMEYLNHFSIIIF